MTELLRKVFAQVEQLPEADQDAYAAAWQAELEEDQRWKNAMDDPHDLALDRLLDQAEEEIARGDIFDMDLSS